MQNPPALIEHKGMRFMIMDAPSDSNLPLYLQELKKNKVTDVVRVCDPTYNADVMGQAGIRVHDWAFADGEAPPATVVNHWLDLVQERFGTKDCSGCIAVHCVAGLGRAPILVAIALVESGVEPEDAVNMIRAKRRGAINSKQLRYLQKYRPRAKGCCVIL
eukprot:comp21582_c0_seq1/m.30166 comp21582_c0_seq1/g.30166  ORF comp21582_c0_seq1/g.30166 comp21582_c0_seq1/m.30166 type:complete len:161 (-) comp21582_c0_seq1:147-629(-)